MYAEVAFPIPLRQTFAYQIPLKMVGKAAPGCRVYAPFGPRRALGYITELTEHPPQGLEDIKELEELIDEEPLFDDRLLRLLGWVADYYMCSLGDVMSAAYPFSLKTHPKSVNSAFLSPSIKESNEIPAAIKGKQQRRVLEFLLEHGEGVPVGHLTKELGISETPVRSLEENGYVTIERTAQVREPWFRSEETSEIPLPTAHQDQVLVPILKALEERQKRTFLLYGVTGSGKTEVYLRAISIVLEQDRTALVLIPEISLTPQTMSRFRARFGDLVGILHSGLGQGERFDEWQLARTGKRRVVVGTRSAVFAPLSNLGLIVVDEEHDYSYKQNDPAPRYNGRDVAVMRAHLSDAVALLGSATPAVESFYNARIGKYHLLSLPSRVADRSLPDVRLIDMRGQTGTQQIVSSELQEALLKRRERGEQSILFLNRRGFATSMACRNCGHVIACPHCSVALVYHQSRGGLLCHHCEHREPPPQHCPKCREQFVRQQGFGTERVVETVEQLMPGVTIARLDRDATRAKGQHDRLLEPFRTGSVDVLVGTQMVAKGLDFPGVTLVGVINADYALSLPDFRAGERIFSLLTQVAGRSGRGEVSGEVLIQTCCPDHYAISLALNQDYDAFFERELRFRKVASFPPFSRLVLWRVEARTEAEARGTAWDLYRLLGTIVRADNRKDVALFPPVEAPIYRLRDHYRWQVSMRTADHRAFRPILDHEQVQKIVAKRRQGLRVVQDVDPIDML